MTCCMSCYSESELEDVLTTYTKLNKSASIFLGSNSNSSPPTKPAHNPVASPSAQRAEMLHRRREAGDADSKGLEEAHRGKDLNISFFLSIYLFIVTIWERYRFEYFFMQNIFKVYCTS